MAHSEHGFSGQSRIIACPGSIHKQRGLEDTSNAAAELGTAVHEMGETGLTFGMESTQSFMGKKFNGIKVTQKMIDAADYYLDCVYEIMRERPDAIMLIETKVKMSSIDESRLWGTADLAIIDYPNRHLIMGDYKNGYGVVDVMPDQYVHATNEVIKGNSQLIGYLIALCDTLNLWQAIDTFEIMVVQPNKGHVDGECRRVGITREQLEKWWHVYRLSHELAIRDDAPLNPGSHCKYCKARATCGINLRNIFDRLTLDENILDANVNDLIQLSELAPVIKTTLAKVDEVLIQEARLGLKVPGKKLVRTIVRAAVDDEDAFVKSAVALGKSADELYNKRLKSKTELKRIVGDDLANKHFVTPERGYTLVDMSDTRVAVMGDRNPAASGKFGKVQ